MNKAVIWLAIVFILIFGIASSFGQTVSEEAKRHFDRGKAACEIAKARADYDAAIKEFEQAAKLAPDWSAAFYNLGVAQEGAEKFADAVQSYREYLRLAPNARDAEEVKSLINKLEYKAIPVLPVAKGFMGIPWGATKEQVIEAMEAQGYRNSVPAQGYAFRTDSAGAPFELHFKYENNSFYNAWSQAIFRSSSPQAAYAAFKQKVNELSKEYGSPSNHKAETYLGNDKVSRPFESYSWALVDQRTSEKYSIEVQLQVTWFTDTEEDQYIVDLYSTAESLYERLKNKGTSTNSAEESVDESLCLAILGGSKDEVESLIAKGADMNAKDKNGSTPLHYSAGPSAQDGQKEVAELLRKHGAK